MKKRHIYVDVDNLYIVNNKIDIEILRQRITSIKSLNMKTHWYGNTFTQKILSKYDIDIDLIDSNVEVNSADHNIIHDITRVKYKNITVITGDITLCRIALYLNPQKNIAFHKFYQNSLQRFFVDFSFKTREHLDKFLRSLILYMKRFP